MEMVVNRDGSCYVDDSNPEWFMKVYLLFWEGLLINVETGDTITQIKTVPASCHNSVR